MKPDLGTDLIDLIGVGVRDSVSEDLFLTPAPIAKSSLLQGVICIWTPVVPHVVVLPTLITQNEAGGASGYSVLYDVIFSSSSRSDIDEKESVMRMPKL